MSGINGGVINGSALNGTDGEVFFVRFVPYWTVATPLELARFQPCWTVAAPLLAAAPYLRAGWSLAAPQSSPAGKHRFQWALNATSPLGLLQFQPRWVVAAPADSILSFPFRWTLAAPSFSSAGRVWQWRLGVLQVVLAATATLTGQGLFSWPGPLTSEIPAFSLWIDGVDRTPNAISIRIEASEDNYVNTVEIACRDAFALLSPDGSGDERVVVSVGGVEWRFLIEEQSRDQSFAEDGFTLWGRSRAARLDEPYALPLEGEEYAPSGWATVLMAALAGEAVALAPAEGVALVDFLIPSETLALRGSTSIRILEQLASAMGGILRALPSGALVVRPSRPDVRAFSLYHATLDASHLRSVNRQEVLASVGNTVVVEGGASLDEDQIWATLEIDEISHPDGTPATGSVNVALRLQEIPVTPPSSPSYRMSATSGAVTFKGSITETKTELLQITNAADIQLLHPALSLDQITPWGIFPGTLSLPEPGKRTLSLTPNQGWEDRFIGLAEVRYTTRYDRWLVSRTGGEKVLVQAWQDDGAESRFRVAVQAGAGEERVIETILEPLIATAQQAETVGAQRLYELAWHRTAMTLEHVSAANLVDGDVLQLSLPGEAPGPWLITGISLRIEEGGVWTTTRVVGNFRRGVGVGGSSPASFWDGVRRLGGQAALMAAAIIRVSYSGFDCRLDGGRTVRASSNRTGESLGVGDRVMVSPGPPVVILSKVAAPMPTTRVIL